MQWEAPQAIDLRFGMEITMSIANRRSSGTDCGAGGHGGTPSPDRPPRPFFLEDGAPQDVTAYAAGGASIVAAVRL